MPKTKTRYKIVVGEVEKFVDQPPPHEEMVNNAWLADARGLAYYVYRCETTVDPHAPTGEKVSMNDTLIFPL